jgi:hypothetical protein
MRFVHRAEDALLTAALAALLLLGIASASRSFANADELISPSQDVLEEPEELTAAVLGPGHPTVHAAHEPPGSPRSKPYALRRTGQILIRP